ncbi:hypothetical protein KIH27_17170 [Mycobacterium sp. M1]|uniref:Uncharacterized protein n=1 Tax=Mycolicibacter acidiphilus TaxID=2835306 RepID=A0ABS5RM97_9MYCO|nr:hypothetical protein [Mycolicibacter acidiphilus]MBS9535319.1 hypothetical protein [Mycolicibacter acidiphilus]
MTDYLTEASDRASENDLADQAVFAGEPLEGVEPFPVGTEADTADLIEQHQSVPSGDDDYDR